MRVLVLAGSTILIVPLDSFLICTFCLSTIQRASKSHCNAQLSQGVDQVLNHGFILGLASKMDGMMSMMLELQNKVLRGNQGLEEETPGPSQNSMHYGGHHYSSYPSGEDSPDEESYSEEDVSDVNSEVFVPREDLKVFLVNNYSIKH